MEFWVRGSVDWFIDGVGWFGGCWVWYECDVCAFRAADLFVFKIVRHDEFAFALHAFEGDQRGAPLFGVLAFFVDRGDPTHLRFKGPHSGPYML